jgi:hypothetical protein
MFEQLDQAMDIGVGLNIRCFQGQGEEFCHLQLKAAKTFNCPFQFALRKWTPCMLSTLDTLKIAKFTFWRAH